MSKCSLDVQAFDVYMGIHRVLGQYLVSTAADSSTGRHWKTSSESDDFSPELMMQFWWKPERINFHEYSRSDCFDSHRDSCGDSKNVHVELLRRFVCGFVTAFVRVGSCGSTGRYSLNANHFALAA